jgi:hypothetical protein
MIRKEKLKKLQRRKRKKRNYLLVPRTFLLLMVCVLLVFVGVQLKIYQTLEGVVAAAKASGPSTAGIKSKLHDTIRSKKPRFIIFHKLTEAQGEGNNVHGLLAAHLLADEFDRIVCVSPHYAEFHLAFEAVDPRAVEHCPHILEKHNKEPPNTRPDHTIELLNYRFTPPNECTLKEKLASDFRVLHLTGNTYPRWPHVPPHINFFAFYKAKTILLEVLPYPHNEPPPIVVHLRQADDIGGDTRKGLDDESLRALGKLLPLDASQHSPFLVTNNVVWYDKFSKEFGWHHPLWDVVMHSALGYQWRELEEPPELSSNQLILKNRYQQFKQEFGVDNWEYLKLWADWYTLLMAQSVYHTFSDFSLSAVHWMSSWSRTYDGIDPKTGKLLLLEENWKIDGESPRLIDRAPDQLEHCDERPEVQEWR